MKGIFLFLFVAGITIFKGNGCLVLQCTFQHNDNYRCCVAPWNATRFPVSCKIRGDSTGLTLKYNQKDNREHAIECTRIFQKQAVCLKNWSTWKGESYNTVVVDRRDEDKDSSYSYQIKNRNLCCSGSQIITRPGIASSRHNFPKIPSSDISCENDPLPDNLNIFGGFSDNSHIDFSKSAYNLTTFFLAVKRYLKSIPLNTTHDLFNGSQSITVKVLNRNTRPHNKLISVSYFNQSTIEMQRSDFFRSGLTLILSEIQIPNSLRFREVSRKVTEKQRTTISLFQPGDVPAVSASVYSAGKHRPVAVTLSYTIGVKNDASFSEFLSNRIETDSGIIRDRVFVKNMTYECNFFDFDSKSYSEYGCHVSYLGLTEVTCYCNHTTIFAVLLSVESYVIPKKVRVVSYVTESVSVFCLVLTFLALYQVRKKLRNDRIVVQLNLTSSLLLLHVFLLFHDLALQNNKACEAFAVFIHFFLLATATWMSIEGITLFMKTTDKSFSFSSKMSKKISRACIVAGWGIPFIIVLISIIIGAVEGLYSVYFDRLETEVNGLFQHVGYQLCRVNNKNNMLFVSTIIPILLLYCINLAIAIKVMIFIYTKSVETKHLRPSKSSDTRDELIDHLVHVKSSLKGLLLLFPVLGVPWIFSFLSGLKNFEARVVFMFLNVTFNGLQGFFLMLVYCVFGREVRRIWTRKLKQKLASFDVFDKRNSRSTNPRGKNELSETAQL